MEEECLDRFHSLQMQETIIHILVTVEFQDYN